MNLWGQTSTLTIQHVLYLTQASPNQTQATPQKPKQRKHQCMLFVRQQKAYPSNHFLHHPLPKSATEALQLSPWLHTDTEGHQQVKRQSLGAVRGGQATKPRRACQGKPAKTQIHLSAAFCARDSAWSMGRRPTVALGRLNSGPVSLGWSLGRRLGNQARLNNNWVH